MKKNVISHEMFQERIWSKTYTALESLIESCYLTQLSIPPNLSGIGGETQSAWREFCTIKMTTSRRAGHTTAICKAALEHFKRAAILSYNQNMNSRTRVVFRNVVNKYPIDNVITKDTSDTIEVNHDNKYFFYSIGQIDHISELKGSVEAVFVDCAFMLSKEKTDKIYDLFGSTMSEYPQNFFIFVQ